MGWMMRERPVAAKRVRMTSRERREQLIGVARSVFAAKGYQATAIEEIAERAEVSKPIVYQHFGGKEGLYAVVVDREVQRLTGSIVSAFDAPTPRLIAEHGADAFLRYIEEHEEGFRVLIRDAPVGMTSGSFASVLSDVAVRAERALAEEFERRGFDVSVAPMYGLMLVGAVALVGEWWLEHRSLPREQVAAHVVNLLYNGLHDLEPQPTTRSLGRRPPPADADGTGIDATTPADAPTADTDTDTDQEHPG